jgi:CRISPR system Cascade subunit CasB
MAGTDLFKQASSFVDALELLSAGERAALKRDVGKTLSFASGNALVAFYRALPNGVSAGLEGRFFAVACTSCLWKIAQLAGNKRPYQECLKQIRADGYESFDKRVNSLLDCHWDDNDGYLQTKLCRISKQMRQKDLLPDFRGLLLDLVGWNDPQRRVQRRWARAYYGEMRLNSTKNDSREEENHVI